MPVSACSGVNKGVEGIPPDVLVQWCDAHDVTADGHTKRCFDRQLLANLVAR